MSQELISSEVKSLYENKRLLPFVGAGLSMCFNLPSWEELIDIIADELEWDPGVFKLSGNFWQLAGYYKAVKGTIGELRSRLDKKFNPTDEQIMSSKAHTAITKMALPAIYTTNFDNIIERAFQLNKKEYRVIRNLGDIAVQPSEMTEIVKFHGTFEDDESLVLTEADYFDRLDFETPLDIKLRADILGKSLLFIGYSFGDINLRYMLHKLHKLRKGERRCLSEATAAIMTTFRADNVQKQLLKNWDVETIELDPVNKADSLARFLESLL